MTSGPPSEGPHGSADDDRRLLEAHVAGDRTAFGVLVSRHRDRLWAVALRTTGDPEEAADALQDAMVAAFRRAESYRGDAAVTTWLHRIVVNACLDRLRRRRVRLAQPLPDDLDAQPTADRLATPQETPLESVERSERRRLVLAALRALPVEQRAALVLVDLQGWSVEEAAAVLEVPAGTVKSRCSRGRAKLAVLLADLREGNAPARSRVEPPGPGPEPGLRSGGERP